MEYTYSGFENRISAEHLKAGEVVKVTGVGNSMTPILKSRQPVICIPVDENTVLAKRDIVLCKVGFYFGIAYQLSKEQRIHLASVFYNAFIEHKDLFQYIHLAVYNLLDAL